MSRARRCSLHLASLFVFFAACANAAAQSTAADDRSPTRPPTVEAAVGVWAPHAEIVGAAEAHGVPGTSINFREDLGFDDRSFAMFEFWVRFARRHKLRLQFSPIEYESADGVALPRDVIFRGVLYPQGTPVTSTLRWKSYHVGYEYDFIARPRGFVGAIVDIERTDVAIRLRSATADEVAPSSVATLPTVGGVARFDAASRFSLMAELTGLKVPDKPGRQYGGHFANVEASATFQASSHTGIRGGYRLMDIRHLGKSDSGTLKLRGPYVEGVVRY